MDAQAGKDPRKGRAPIGPWLTLEPELELTLTLRGWWPLTAILVPGNQDLLDGPQRDPFNSSVKTVIEIAPPHLIFLVVTDKIEAKSAVRCTFLTVGVHVHALLLGAVAPEHHASRPSSFNLEASTDGRRQHPPERGSGRSVAARL